MPPSQKDHHPAIRCAIGIAVPLLTLLAIGHTELAIFAALGAFTGVYGRGKRHRARFEQQWRAGLFLLTAIAAGVLSSQYDAAPGFVVACTALVGGMGFIATGFNRMNPSGSLFFVFSYSAIAFLAQPAPFGPAMLTAGLSVLVSLIVGVAGWVLPGHHTPWVSPPRQPLTAVEQAAVLSEAWLHVASVAIAGEVAVVVGFGHSYWAMIAATVPLVGATAARRLSRGVQRILGTASGLVITGILLGLALNDWQMVLIVLVLQFLVELFVTRHYALAQTFVTPLALLMTEVARPTNPWSLIRDRGIETLIGATVGMLLVIWLHRIAPQDAAE